MASEKDNIIEFNQYIKPDKMPYIIYADIECLTEKIDGCANNPKHFCKDEKFFAVKRIMSILLANIQCQLYVLLIIWKTSIFYIVGKIV